jgi:protein-L-isoaspartate(D-aspartate) O-methyltransferase
MDSSQLVRELLPHVHDRLVIDAIAHVPRDVFVPGELRGMAWENEALPLSEGQTISQPLVVATMCAMLHLRGREKVLEIGTGSGYHAAVLARLTGTVISIERHPELAENARQALRFAGVTNVTVIDGDGSHGLPGEAPFDAISVSAASRGEPSRELIEQLAEGGRMVIPVADDEGQRLVLFRNLQGRIDRIEDGEVRFVPLISDN